MDNNHYNSRLKIFARSHRNDSTKAEIRMWCELLRNKKMLGYSFLRQRPIANYIADFFSKDLKLVIEVDGLSHEWEGQFEKDKAREDILKALGFHVLRFSDDEVMNDIENVDRTIQHFIAERGEKIMPGSFEMKDFSQGHPPVPFRRGMDYFLAINSSGARGMRDNYTTSNNFPLH